MNLVYNQTKKSQTKLAAMTLLLILSLSAFMAVIPLAKAHTPPWTVPTWCYISTTNSIIGVNQQQVLIFWLNAPPPTSYGAYGDRWTFTVEVTKPNGSKETLGPFTSDPVGSGWTIYTPTEVGTYTFAAKFPGKVITGLPIYPGLTKDTISGAASVNDTYSASESDSMQVVVQKDAIEAWSETPLPTQYWTRPLNSANRGWYVLAGNWLAGVAQRVGSTTSFGYGTGPESAHIMWSIPIWDGGIMDARSGETGYQTAHYDGLDFSPPIVLNGRLYYNVRSSPKIGWHCIDLYTGDELFFHNTTGAVNYALRSDSSGALLQEALSFGQILNYESPNQHGGYPYLWSTYGPGMPTGKPSSGGQSWPTGNQTWMMFDAYSGDWICNIANVSASGTNVYGSDGSILYYNIVGTGANRRLTVWNTTHAIQEGCGPNSKYPMRNWYWCWRPFLNMTFDGSLGFSLNATIPSSVQGSIRTVFENQYVIGGTAGSNDEQGITKGHLWALSLKSGQEGALMWDIAFTPPSSAGNKTISMGTVDPEDGVFLFSCTQTRQRWGYSLETGQQLWASGPEPAMNYYGMSSNIYEGKLFGSGYGGVLIAYDIKTGKVVWNYTAAQEGFESPYGNFPIGIACIADGKLYLTSSEHSPTQPLWRGSYLRCVNASNGVELWKILNWGMGMGAGSGAVVADGYVLSLNAYDNQIYCYGKGQSAITAAVQNDVITQGNSVLIKGMVTDQCAGAKAIAEKAGFANGIPAVSDADQQEWMEYLYMQQAKPADAIGIQVHLTAIDPNGNFQDIGTVTSDDSGLYSALWTPPVPGKYVVTAKFEGSRSYYQSSAKTAFGVTEAVSAAPVVTPTPTATQPPITPISPTPIQTPVSPSPSQAPSPAAVDMTTTYIAIAAAVIIIVAVAAALVLRRRK